MKNSAQGSFFYSKNEIERLGWVHRSSFLLATKIRLEPTPSPAIPRPMVGGDPSFLAFDLEAPGVLGSAASRLATMYGEVIFMVTGPDLTSIKMANNSLVTLASVNLRRRVVMMAKPSISLLLPGKRCLVPQARDDDGRLTRDVRAAGSTDGASLLLELTSAADEAKRIDRDVQVLGLALPLLLCEEAVQCHACRPGLFGAAGGYGHGVDA